MNHFFVCILILFDILQKIIFIFQYRKKYRLLKNYLAKEDQNFLGLEFLFVDVGYGASLRVCWTIIIIFIYRTSIVILVFVAWRMTP
jgi:hypothetical protein